MNEILNWWFDHSTPEMLEDVKAYYKVDDEDLCDIVKMAGVKDKLNENTDTIWRWHPLTKSYSAVTVEFWDGRDLNTKKFLGKTSFLVHAHDRT